MSDTQIKEVDSTTLGKRKRAENYVLQLSGGSESELELTDVPKSLVASTSKAKLSTTPTIVNGNLVFGEKRKYVCTIEGCGKSYTKPCRLEEHERTHSGERPYVCTVCKKSYLRESHLQAHVRSHLPDSARNFVCTRPGCDKKFWTVQHLRRHEALHDGKKPFKCQYQECDMGFSKHHQLRSHIAEVHCPAGTKPFRCEHNNCTKSFPTSQKLKAHSKTHEERRYVCSHPKCLANEEPVYFPTWTALQAHHRIAHPATCPYPSCNGKTFTQQKGLRAHLKIHEQQEVEASLVVSCRAEDNDADDEDEGRPVKRRRGGEVGRDWKCDVVGCGKDFKSSKALNVHHNVTHLQKRDWACEVQGCGMTFGYKHLLQRHSSRIHSATGEESTKESTTEAAKTDTNKPSAIDILTGVAYVERAKLLSNTRKLHKCPIRTFASSSELLTDCAFEFSRAYDLKRHLSAVHDVDITREDADDWVRDAARSRV